MRQTANQLSEFYASPMGRAARVMALRRLTALWPPEEEEGRAMLGLGYAGPYLMPYAPKAKKVILTMPAAMGVIPTKSRRGNVAALVEDDALPLPPASFDRVLLVHAIEESADFTAVLAEAWRVLAPEGRLVIIAANRSGLWARSDASPFGAGRPFSRSQLANALKNAQFLPLAWAGALYAPPISRMTGPRFLSVMERFGETVWPRFSGLVLVEAVKRLYAGTDGLSSEEVRAPLFPKPTPVLERGSQKN